jgi:PDZ domain-containing secreted protein
MQGQLFQNMEQLQQTILQTQSTDERTLSRKRKSESQGDASNMLDERTMKQLKISRAQQVGYDK